MILLSGHGLTPEKKIPLESMSLRMKERESMAEIVPAEMTGITMQSWLQDDTEPGAGIVWRVATIMQDYAQKTPTVKLEHAIGTLRDRIMFGEITPDTIKGTVGATTCTALEAITYILAQQSDWTLGTFGYGTVENAYKFDGDSLYDALDKVSDTLDECWWSYDFSTYPFKINIGPKPSGVTCELRPGRNLISITKSIDRTGMYTRHYPIGKADLHITGDYVSKNENLYGVISKVEVDQSLETEAELRAWSNQRLSKHAEPVVNITADGLELADATGESLDDLKLGRICRVPLQEFGTVIEERIVELNYRDKISEPEVVRITMANNHDDVVKIIAEEIKTGGGRGGGGSRGNARDRKQDLAWFEDTNSHVAMVAEGIVGVDAQGNPNWFRLSQIIVNENGIDSSVQSIQGDMDDVNTWKVTAESRITQTESSISQVVTAIGDNGQVTAASIILAINGDTSSANISADKIVIGELSNEDLDTWASDAVNGTGTFAKFLTVRSLSAQEITTMLADIGDATISSIDVGHIDADSITVNTGITTDSIYTTEINGNDIDNFIADASVSGNTLTLTKTDGTTVTFSKAASVTLSGAWSGSVSAGKSYKVTASPGGETHYSPSLDGMAASASSKTWASDYKSFDQEISVYDSNSEDLYKETLTFNTTQAWNAGSNAAGVVIDASNGEVKVAASTSTKSVSITADVVATYNSTTHKYSVRGIAKAGSSQMDSVTDLTGTEAFDAGVIAGQGGVYTGVTAREVLSSGGTEYYPASSTTVVGRGDSVTAREVVSSGGTLYYKSTGSSTVYPGNGGSFTVQGTTGPKLYFAYTQKTLYQKNSDGTYSSVGMHNWYYTSSSGTQYYNAGSTTKYDRGSSYTVYTRETSSIRLGDSGTYYKGNGGTKTVQSSTAIHLGASETLYRKST